jgi:hypothetical protein
VNQTTKQIHFDEGNGEYSNEEDQHHLYKMTLPLQFHFIRPTKQFTTPYSTDIRQAIPF